VCCMCIKCMHCCTEGMSGVLYVQTVEHFAWNVRVLKGQADLLRHAQNTCTEDMKQVRLPSLGQ